MNKQKFNLSILLMVLFAFLLFNAQIASAGLNELQDELSGREINKPAAKPTPPPKPFQLGTVENRLAQYNFSNSFEGIVKAQPYLNVRAIPSKSGQIIGKLPNGTKISLLGTCNEWYIINYYGKKAYIWASNIVLLRPKATPKKPESQPNEDGRISSQNNNGRIKDDSLTNKPITDTAEANISKPQKNETSSSSLNLSTVEGIVSAIKEKFGVSLPTENTAVKWTVEILKNVYELFTKVPKAFYAQLKQIKMVSEATANKVCGMAAGGYVMSNDPSTIYLSTACIGDVQGTLVHEMTHSYHFANPSIIEKFQKQFWSSGRNGYSGSYEKPVSASVTKYGNTNPMEDLAESVRAYYQGQNNWRDYETNNRVQATDAAKARFEFIKNNIMSGQEF
ncbi:MAG: SH3 domain-containing protein [Candidatus Wallbacteria bacterium]